MTGFLSQFRSLTRRQIIQIVAIFSGLLVLDIPVILLGTWLSQLPESVKIAAFCLLWIGATLCFVGYVLVKEVLIPLTLDLVRLSRWIRKFFFIV